ncbi:MAG: glycosyltransferase family 4 protein [Lachnospiraceae bacterium]|nr:glycosyltransferase family 4 protein [Lachnospiraceae bacterium]
MKIVLLSNYFNHHQKSISDEFYKYDSSFRFVQTAEMSEERKKLGYLSNYLDNYIICYQNNKKEVEEMLRKADVVIIGSAPNSLLKFCKKNALIFRYSERPFKKEQSMIRMLYHAIKGYINNVILKSTYLLCASAYTSYDYSRLGLFRKKAYKWGYFPETKKYDIDVLLENKEQNSILWCGRFIDWKHPEIVVQVAEKLKSDGYGFHINMIGVGEMLESIKKMIEEKNLIDNITLLGSMSPDEVRTYMEKASIFLFTSDRQEGWGAVLNESMNSGCAIVASHEIGAVPYLLKDKVNGLVYQTDDFIGLYQQVIFLLERIDEQRRLGKNGYQTIAKEWNSKIAAERFIVLSQHLLEGEKQPNLFESGPCSKSDIIIG